MILLLEQAQVFQPLLGIVNRLSALSVLGAIFAGVSLLFASS